VRGYIPAPAAVHEVVAGIVASVEEGGDPALVMHERRFGGGEAPLRVPEDELRAALEEYAGRRRRFGGRSR
jgi:histidinol dehydrogenase